MTNLSSRSCTATIAIALAVVSSVALAQAAPFVPLFNGKTLDGWVVENSDGANFSVRDGVLHVEGPQGWLWVAGQTMMPRSP